MGGGGLSTAAMAHGGQLNPIQQPNVSSHSQIPGGTGGRGTAAPGTSYAALGADLLDKNQSFLSGKNVRAVAKLPIVAIDMYGDTTSTSYFPPMPKEDGNGNGDEMMAMMKSMDKLKKGVLVRNVKGLNEDYYGTNITLKKDDSDAYKAVKKFLNNGEGYGNVLEKALVTDTKKLKEEDAIVIPRPHLLMGMRQLGELNDVFHKSTFAALLGSPGEGSSAIIEEGSSSTLSLSEIAMDGSSQPKNDDYDRVVYQMKLNSKKKQMNILPEEVVSILIAKCKQNVMQGYFSNEPDCELNNFGLPRDKEDEEDEEESYMDYPAAFAIPGWATYDPTIEALISAASAGAVGQTNSCGPTLHQRSIAACVGTLLPPPTSPPKNKNEKPTPPQTSRLTKLLMETMQSKDADANKEAAKQAALNRTEPVEPDSFVPLVVLVGATKEGIEITAVQITKPQGSDKELHCPFGNISVVSSVCYAHSDASSILNSTLDEIRTQIGIVVPESEEPTAFVTYGTIDMQTKLNTKLKAILTKYGKDGQNDDNWDGWDHDIPIISTKEECVSMGLAILGATVHGRVRVIVPQKGTDGKMRPKAKLGVSVQDVATCAVAISYNYFGGQKDKWTEPKVIFDFDRRVPAGPYQIDITAAESAAHVQHGVKTGERCMADDNEIIDATKALEGSKGIPDREKAALQLRFRIYQKTSRGEKEWVRVDSSEKVDDSHNDDWVRVGNVLRPLAMHNSQRGADEQGEDDYVAIENERLSLSLNNVGILTIEQVTNGETIVQATKSARNNKLLKWGGIIGSILFIGGFLVKSFVEERVFERDTQRVLAYYKHAAANSFHDGDERHARYMVWKYKGKKDKLWRRLEAKYDIPVKHAWEWPEEVEGETKKDHEDEAEDLDGGGSDNKGGSDGDGDEL